MIDVTDKLEDTKELLKTRVCTDFCKKCPNAHKTFDMTCDYVKHATWEIVFMDEDTEQAINEFTCFFNIERLTLTKG